MTSSHARPVSHERPLNTYLAQALRLAKHTAQDELERLTRDAINAKAKLKAVKKDKRKAKRAARLAERAWIEAVEGAL